jgi:hypothetical protein
MYDQGDGARKPNREEVNTTGSQEEAARTLKWHGRKARLLLPEIALRI